MIIPENNVKSLTPESITKKEIAMQNKEVQEMPQTKAQASPLTLHSIHNPPQVTNQKTPEVKVHRTPIIMHQETLQELNIPKIQIPPQRKISSNASSLNSQSQRKYHFKILMRT